MLIVSSDAAGRIVAFDSSTYLERNQTNVHSVVAIGSSCGTRVLAPIFARGAKAIIPSDAGIGKDEAGISGLKHAETIGVPVAAIKTMSAETSYGRSTLLGEISRVNAQARALGVVPGQPAWEAAALIDECASRQTHTDADRRRGSAGRGGDSGQRADLCSGAQRREQPPSQRYRTTWGLLRFADRGDLE